MGVFPHRRRNPLTGDFLLVSPHRTERPWQGAQEDISLEKRPEHDPQCYLCPGNTRANGMQNPQYENTFAFTNDFSALLANDGTQTHQDTLAEDTALFHSEPTQGECRVLCFSPRHDLSLAEMTTPELLAVVKLWINQYAELEKKYAWVQLFENKGSVMGCSNPHPHGQVWASDFLPNEARKEERHQHAYFKEHGEPLLFGYAKAEIARQERIVCQNQDWLVVVPYWASWPFETLLLPKFKVSDFNGLGAEQQHSLADILKDHLGRYDRLFQCSFPYSMGWHGYPDAASQLHAHFYPPLLRSASVKKFMVGYEMLAETQRDLTAEQAAARLRAA